MKKLNELRSLVNLARKFGQEPSPAILEQIERLERDEQRQLQREQEIKNRIAQDLDDIFNKEPVHELVQSSPSTPEPKQETAEPSAAIASEATIANQVARVITESGVVAPDPVLARPGRNLEAEVRRLEQWISRIAATGPGSGEVNLRYLDDVDRNSIADHLYLRYDQGIKKFTFDHGYTNSFYIQAQSHLTQTSSATSASAMIYEVTDFGNGISIDGGNSSQIVVAHPGRYNLQFSVQLYNIGNASDSVYIWLSQNGQNVENSNSIVTVPAKDNNNNPGAVIAGWNLVFETHSQNEYVQLLWFTNDETHTFIAAVSSQAATVSTPYLPAVPSVLVTVSTLETY